MTVDDESPSTIKPKLSGLLADNWEKSMGEAKRRRETDPFFGRRPKAGKGIVISSPVTIDERGTLSIRPGIDPVELRRAVLFWDRLIKPKNYFIHAALTMDEEFLQECGILEELTTDIGEFSGLNGHAYARCHLAAFYELERKEPGLWAMSEGENSFNLQAGKGFADGRGALVELHRAIPLPTKDVPLEDLLEFKHKRRDEVLSLSLELDALFSRIANGKDVDFETGRAVREIDQKCRDMISAGRESKIQFSLSDTTYGFSFETSNLNILAGGFFGNVMGASFDLPTVGAAIGAAASCIRFKADLGGPLQRSKKSADLALSPYRVVSRLMNEPI